MKGVQSLRVVAMVAAAAGSTHLDDVILVLVVRDVRLVEQRVVHILPLLVNMILVGGGARGIDRRAALDDGRLHRATRAAALRAGRLLEANLRCAGRAMDRFAADDGRRL